MPAPPFVVPAPVWDDDAGLERLRRPRDRSPRERTTAFSCRLVLADTPGLPHMVRSKPHSAPSPLVGEGWGGGCLFDSADLIPPSRLAHAKSDVSDLANVHAEIGNCRFRMARDPASPTRGEVTGASCRAYAIA